MARGSSRARKNAPDKVLLEIDDASVVKDVRRGVTVRGSLLQAVRVRDGKKGPNLQFEFRDVRRYDIRTLRDPFRIVLSVASGNTPLPRKAEGPAYAESETVPPPAQARSRRAHQSCQPAGPFRGPRRHRRRARRPRSRHAA